MHPQQRDWTSLRTHPQHETEENQTRRNCEIIQIKIQKPYTKKSSTDNISSAKTQTKIYWDGFFKVKAQNQYNLRILYIHIKLKYNKSLFVKRKER